MRQQKFLEGLQFGPIRSHGRYTVLTTVSVPVTASVSRRNSACLHEVVLTCCGVPSNLVPSLTSIITGI